MLTYLLTQARHDGGVSAWQSGRFHEANAILSAILSTLDTTSAAAAAALGAATTASEQQLRIHLAEQRVVLELSAAHNLGLALHDR